MKNENNKSNENSSSKIKIFGVGGGAGNAINYMFNNGIKDVDYIFCNTDNQALKSSPVTKKITMGQILTEGRGAGNNPDIGRQAAIENIDDITNVLANNTKMAIIIAGMGGGTGTGAAPVIAKAAKELGILTIAIVSTPFKFEGQRRMKQALSGIAKMEKYLDSLIVINYENLRDINKELKFSEAFSQGDNILYTAAKSIAEIITVPGYINVDFEDVETVLKNSGVSIFGTAVSKGKNRGVNALKAALSSSFFNKASISDAHNILLNISTGSIEITMDEIGEISDYLNNLKFLKKNIIWGTGVEKDLGDSIRISILATGYANDYVDKELYDSDTEDILAKQFASNDNYLSLFFIDNEYSPEEIAEIISLLSELYKEIGGDELVIKGTNIYESSRVFEPNLI